MKTYDYGTDAGTGTIEADSALHALTLLGINAETVADGAFGWAETADGSELRLTIRTPEDFELASR